MDDPGSDERSRPGAAEEMPGLSPVRAFFLLAAVAGLIPLGMLATREEAVPSEPPGAARSPDYSLTDAEAIAEFERLHALQIRIYRSRDVSLVAEVYTPDSPVADRVIREVTRMVRRGVTARPSFDTRNISVTSNDHGEVQLVQTVLVDAAFFDEEGNEVSLEAPSEVQRVLWTLRERRGKWLIHDALVTKVVAVRK